MDWDRFEEVFGVLFDQKKGLQALNRQIARLDDERSMPGDQRRKDREVFEGGFGGAAK